MHVNARNALSLSCAQGGEGRRLAFGVPAQKKRACLRWRSLGRWAAPGRHGGAADAHCTAGLQPTRRVVRNSARPKALTDDSRDGFH